MLLSFHLIPPSLYRSVAVWLCPLRSDVLLIIMKMRRSSAEQALSEWMNDLVDRNQHSDWIPDNSCCFRVRPITCSLACLYGNLLNGCQGLRPKTFTHSPYMGVENYMVWCRLMARGDIKQIILWCLFTIWWDHVVVWHNKKTNPLQNGRPRK